MIKIFLLLLFVFLSTAAPAGKETVAERFGIHRLLKSTRRNTNSSIVHQYTPTNSSISDESLDDSSRRNLYQLYVPVSTYVHYPSLNCFNHYGSGDWSLERPVGTGAEECKKLCNALPYGNGENQCSLIVVRSNGQCYLKNGPFVREKCQNQGSSKATYVRTPVD